MCGIAGFVNLDGSPAAPQIARAMADRLVHRGPDDAGVWSEGRVAFGHRRLSIIDLSPAGHQPMLSGDGRWVIVYNGEVYNFAELRRELEADGCRFRGHSDTEAIVETVARFGLDATLERLIGMFAFALWDRRERRLHLVRDRLGIKPLYWGEAGGRFMFGSELKALRACPGWEAEIDRDALTAFLRHNYVPGPATVYRGIHKLKPGHRVTLDANGACTEHCFWDFAEVARQGAEAPLALDESEAVAELDALLGDAVERRMVADVPLGVFLSGGIDSSTVTALMQARAGRRVRSFSIGFWEPRFNEAEHARAVAAHLGTDHTELYVTAQDALDTVPHLADWYDEPFGDSSQIPTYLLSRMTRGEVTVALSGDGGDEVFAGYSRYIWSRAAWGALKSVPAPIRRPLGRGLGLLPRSAWLRLVQMGPKAMRPGPMSYRAYMLPELMAARDPEDLYLRMISQWDEPERVVLGGHEPRRANRAARSLAGHPDIVARMQAWDTETYLPDDILTKVDRASMAVSLEVRVPLLDHRVVAFAWSLPAHMKLRDGAGKWILRRVLDRYVPRTLIERPKTGFAVPLADWLRGPLRDWAEDLLDPHRLAAEGLFDAAEVRRRWRELLHRNRPWHESMWGVLMVQAWRRRWLEAVPRDEIRRAAGD